MAGIYIHIPFCKQACSYCDFYFVTRQSMRQDFLDRLCEEIDSHRESIHTREPVETIYFGGGTPSLLKPSELACIFDHLCRVFNIRAGEVTMEMNPDDITSAYLSDLLSIGIDRVSMGVQSFDPARLLAMNRAHNPVQALQALEDVKNAGFKTFTTDIIYGNPGQTRQELEKDLDILLQFDPPHISAYSLTIEPNTRLGKQVELGRVTPAPDDEVAAQFDLLTGRLAAAGLERYEISNYSKPGFEAVHNTRYWHHENYLGMGPSAHSFHMEEAGGRRWKVISDLKTYLTRPFAETRVEKEELSRHVLAEERLVLGLRTRWGVSLDELQNRYHYQLSARQLEWLGTKEEEGLLEVDKERVRLRDAGLRIADHLVVELLVRH